MARSRGIEVIRGIAERIPVCSETCDFTLLMTSLCFVQDPAQAAWRRTFLRRGGKVMVGSLERGGEIVTTDSLSSDKGRFLRYAHFRISDEITAS
jgi:hypothetical protein